jgi:hypothetical protein
MSDPQHGGRSRGRPRKPGKRQQFHAVLPVTLVELLRQDAAAHGIALGDRLAEILADRYSKQEAMQKAS